MPYLIFYHIPTKEINGWVEKKTRDKIKNLIKPTMLNQGTVFVLINAIYFKAKWKYPFKKSSTRSKLFYTESKSQGIQPKKVQMMDLTGTLEFADLSSLQSTMLRLPYQGDRIVLDILLPKPNTSKKTWSSKPSIGSWPRKNAKRTRYVQTKRQTK